MERTYYDHEGFYRKIKEEGGKSWEHLFDNPEPYHELIEFLRSNYCPEGRKAIDLGCGGGQASFMLFDKGFDVLGVEYAETAVEIAKGNARNLGKSVDFRRGDILNLEGVTSESFDLVVDNHVSHCILPQDRPRYFSETSRLLKQGGIYFGSVMAVTDPFKPEDLEAMNLDPETRIHKKGNRFLVTEKEFMEELVLHGLFPLSIKKDNFDRPSYMDLTVYAKKKGFHQSKVQ